MKKIAIASDHAGYEYKEFAKKQLEGKYELVDFGTNGLASVDYPDFVYPAASAVENGDCAFGVLFCGSGQCVQLSANKHAGVRCALVWMPEIAELSRLHNNCNMVAMPARFIAKELSVEIIEKFLTTDFEGGRHQSRVDKITCK